MPTLLLPLAKLVTVGAMALGLWLGRVPFWVRRAFAELPRLSQWAMIEVFLRSIGIDAALDRKALSALRLPLAPAQAG